MKYDFLAIVFWKALIPLFLAILAIVLRLQGFEPTSITQDESTIILFAQGVLERGYPFLLVGSREFLISTYELVPYPIAFSLWYLGFSEFAVRLPALCFSVGTILLIFYFAAYLFDNYVALLAALLYAILPWAIYWGSNSFYPAQLQFFVLLTIIVGHQLLYNPQVKWKWYYFFTLFFIFTYFTWEASGILLPIVFLIALLLRWKQWYWINNLHAWFAASLIIFVVAVQLTYKTLLHTPYEKIGSRLAQISFFQNIPSHTDYDPFFFLRILADSEAHIILAGFVLLGLFFFKSNWNMRFLYLLIIFTLVFLTMFLGLYTLRYSYFLLPFLLIVAAATVFLLVEYWISYLKRVSLFSVKIFKWICIGLLSAIQLLTASPWGLQPVELFSWLQTNKPFEFQHDYQGFSFRSIAQQLQEYYRPGDIVIMSAPFPFKIYTGISGDYYIQDIVVSTIRFDPSQLPYYAGKWVGNTVLRSATELEEVLYQHARVWFVSVPHKLMFQRQSKNVQELIVNRMTLVAESVQGRLYLWENPAFITKK